MSSAAAARSSRLGAAPCREWRIGPGRSHETSRPSLFRSRPRREKPRLKGGRLPSLMRHMLNLHALGVAMMLSVVFLSGCSDILGDQREEADDAVAEANSAIAEHNQLFDQARGSYATARENIEAGDEPDAQKERITDARETLQEARNNLQDASDRMEEVRKMDVDPTIREYANLLSEAMNAQLAAEAREIEFYEIMEEDPALAGDRERALGILSEASDGYGKAEESYARARELASNNPDIIKLPPASNGAGGQEVKETTINAPENQKQGEETAGG